jgi:hypothetical protein
MRPELSHDAASLGRPTRAGNQGFDQSDDVTDAARFFYCHQGWSDWKAYGEPAKSKCHRCDGPAEVVGVPMAAIYPVLRPTSFQAIGRHWRF